MAIRYGRGDVKQTTAGFRGPLMVQSLTSAKSKFLSLMKDESSHISQDEKSFVQSDEHINFDQDKKETTSQKFLIVSVVIAVGFLLISFQDDLQSFIINF